MGTRVDLLVDAVPRDHDPSGVVTVPIEVKGSWHHDVYTALHRQLIPEYVQPVGSRAGVYLVVWCDDEWWDRGDPRRRVARLRSRGDLVDRLRAQASQARQEGYLIEVVVLDASLTPLPRSSE